MRARLRGFFLMDPAAQVLLRYGCHRIYDALISSSNDLSETMVLALASARSLDDAKKLHSYTAEPNLTVLYHIMSILSALQTYVYEDNSPSAVSERVDFLWPASSSDPFFLGARLLAWDESSSPMFAKPLPLGLRENLRRAYAGIRQPGIGDDFLQRLKRSNVVIDDDLFASLEKYYYTRTVAIGFCARWFCEAITVAPLQSAQTNTTDPGMAAAANLASAFTAAPYVRARVCETQDGSNAIANAAIASNALAIALQRRRFDGHWVVADFQMPNAPEFSQEEQRARNLDAAKTRFVFIMRTLQADAENARRDPNLRAQWISLGLLGKPPLDLGASTVANSTAPTAAAGRGSNATKLCYSREYLRSILSSGQPFSYRASTAMDRLYMQTYGQWVNQPSPARVADYLAKEQTYKIAEEWINEIADICT